MNYTLKILVVSLFFFILFNSSTLVMSEEKAQVDPKIEKEFTAECARVFRAKCSQCHTLDQISALKKTQEEWVKIAEQMRCKPGAKISPEDSRHILYYIFKEMPLAEP